MTIVNYENYMNKIMASVKIAQRNKWDSEKLQCSNKSQEKYMQALEIYLDKMYPHLKYDRMLGIGGVEGHLVIIQDAYDSGNYDGTRLALHQLDIMTEWHLDKCAKKRELSEEAGKEQNR